MHHRLWDLLERFIIFMGQSTSHVFFLLCYLIYRLLKHCCCACVALRRGNAHQAIPGNEGDHSFPTERQPLLKPPTTSLVTMTDHDEDDGYADRMINPNRYNKEDTL